MLRDDDRLVICEYDPAWPDLFAKLAAKVDAALGRLVSRIEHIGSTAVTGLSAKPIIDLDVVLASPAGLPEAMGRLEAIGYRHEGDLGIPGREAFRWPPGEARHHLYVLGAQADELRRHLAFRDALRADPALRDRYAALKRSLAGNHSGDREVYIAGKSTFIEAVLRSSEIAGMSGDRKS